MHSILSMDAENRRLIGLQSMKYAMFLYLIFNNVLLTSGRCLIDSQKLLAPPSSVINIKQYILYNREFPWKVECWLASNYTMLLYLNF